MLSVPIAQEQFLLKKENEKETKYFNISITSDVEALSGVSSCFVVMRSSMIRTYAW